MKKILYITALIILIALASIVFIMKIIEGNITKILLFGGLILLQVSILLKAICDKEF